MQQIARVHVFRVSPLLHGHNTLAVVETLRFGGLDGTASVLARLLLLLPWLSAHVDVKVLFWCGLSI